jgi:hypothetical protein
MLTGAEEDNLHYSYDTFDTSLVEILQLIQPKNVTDIGAGHGKYGTLIRDNFPDSQISLTAVEAVETCRDILNPIYDEILIKTADEMMNSCDRSFDTIILGDVIEHMRFSDGLDLIHFLVHRSAYIIIITPEAMPQSVDGNFYASHNSIWRPEAFATLDLFLHARICSMHLYIIRGYLDFGRPTLNSIATHVNSLNLSGAVFQARLSGNVKLNLHDTVSADLDGEGQTLVYRPK